MPRYILEFVEITVERCNGNRFVGGAGSKKRVGKTDIDGLQALQCGKHLSCIAKLHTAQPQQC